MGLRACYHMLGRGLYLRLSFPILNFFFSGFFSPAISKILLFYFCSFYFLVIFRMTEISKFLVFILRSLSLKCNMILHIDFSGIYKWYFVVLFPRSLPGTFYRPFFDRKKVGTEKSVGTVKTFVTEVKTFGTDLFLKTTFWKIKRTKT